MTRVLVLDGVESGIGKTAIAAALISELRRRQLTVQPFNVGTKISDASTLSSLSGRRALTLDPWILSKQQAVAAFYQHTRACNVALVEGSSHAAQHSDIEHRHAVSTATICEWLQLPTVLVIDAAGGSDAAAQQAERWSSASAVGVLLNNVGSGSHEESELRAALEGAGMTLPILGFIPQDPAMAWVGACIARLDGPLEGAARERLAALASRSIDVDRLLHLCAWAPPAPLVAPPATKGRAHKAQIGVAQDAAFGHLYRENLLLLEQAGADLVPFSPLEDQALMPGLAALYIGGAGADVGRCAAQLAANRAMRAGVRAFAEAGGIVYAEAGGLVFLSKSLQHDGDSLPMCGALPFRTQLLSGSGATSPSYVEVQIQPGCRLFPASTCIRGHFDSTIQVLEERPARGLSATLQPAAATAEAGAACSFAYEVRLAGQAESDDAVAATTVSEGYSLGNVLASLVHLHFGSAPQVAAAFVQAATQTDLAEITDAAAAAVAKAQEQQRQQAQQLLQLQGLLPQAEELSAAAEWQLQQQQQQQQPWQRCPSTQSLPDMHYWQSAPAAGGWARPAAPASCYGGESSSYPHQHQHGGGGCSSHYMQQAGSYGADMQRSSSTPHSLHDADAYAAATAQHAQHAHPRGRFQPPPLLNISIPKRWSLDSLGGKVAAVAAAAAAAAAGGGGGGGRSAARDASSSSADTGGSGQQAKRKRRTSMLALKLKMMQEPELPEDTRKVLDELLPASGRTHTRVIGLACPLSPAVGPPPAPNSPRPEAAAAAPAVAASGGTPLAAQPAAAAAGGAGYHNPTLYSRAAAALAASSARSGSSGSLTGLVGRENSEGRLMEGYYPAGSAGSRPSSRPNSRPSSPQHRLTRSLDSAAKLCDRPVGGFGAPQWLTDGIVSLAPAATDMLAWMGLTGRLVGISNLCTMTTPPPLPLNNGHYNHHHDAGIAAAAPPVVCRTELKMPLAAVKAAPAVGAVGRVVLDIDEDYLRDQQPALVIIPGGDDMYTIDKPAVQRALERAALLRYDSNTAVLFQSCRTLAEVMDFILLLGKAAAASEQALLLVGRLQQRLRAAARLAAVPAGIPAGPDGSSSASAAPLPRPRVLLLESLLPFVRAGRWSIELLQLAGGAAAGDDGRLQAGDPAEMLRWPAVRQTAPEYLIVTHSFLSVEQLVLQVADLAGLPGWWSLPAVRSGRVYIVDGSLLARPGPGLVDGVEVLAAILRQQQQQQQLQRVPLLPPPSAHMPRGRVLKLSLHGGQRCRQSLLPNYFQPWEPTAA